MLLRSCSDSAPFPFFSEVPVGKKKKGIQRNAECLRKTETESLEVPLLYCLISKNRQTFTKNICLSSVLSVEIKYVHKSFYLVLPSSCRHLQVFKISVESEKKNHPLFGWFFDYSGYFEIKSLLRIHNAFVGVFNHHKASKKIKSYFSFFL